MNIHNKNSKTILISFGASRRSVKGRSLGSVSDYCVNHIVCPVVVVRFPDAVESPSRVNG
ncbi:putative rossmann-like alpha/beta/alpha sandwich protein [Helianthus anomalus]